MSIEAILALAIKNYRVIVDSRRFIPLASEEEFKRVFDEVLSGLLDNLSEVFVFDDNEDIIRVNPKLISLGTDILKLLITLKHFINQPVYADEVLHQVFEKAAHLNDFKIVSQSPDFDDHKAKKRFETFLVNLYVLLYEDSSLNLNIKGFLNNMSSSRLQTVLFEAAPRVSQEEIYHKSYRHLLLGISSINETVPQIIKRLDSYFPEPELLVDGLSRKDFLLERLGWDHLTVYQCADKIHKQICSKDATTAEAVQNFEYFWILLHESKFVAVNECCATLFIFPSECESFLKACQNLSNCFTEITKKPDLTEDQAKVLNRMNNEISVWIRKLVKAVGSNYIHFERDLNNRSCQKTNKQLYKIIVVLTNFSKGIYEELQQKFEGMELARPASEIKLVADFIERPEKFSTASEECLNEDATVETDENSNSYSSSAEPFVSTGESKDKNQSQDAQSNIVNHTAINMPKSSDSLKVEKDQVPVWAIAIAVISTIVAVFCVKSIFIDSDKS